MPFTHTSNIEDVPFTPAARRQASLSWVPGPNPHVPLLHCGGVSLSMQACRKLVDKFGLEPSQYQVGRTKIFFRPGVLGFVED
eukprot:scaffold269961_cov17-Tisochrysis_lutea.AAC.1